MNIVRWTQFSRILLLSWSGKTNDVKAHLIDSWTYLCTFKELNLITKSTKIHMNINDTTFVLFFVLVIFKKNLCTLKKNEIQIRRILNTQRFHRVLCNYGGQLGSPTQANLHVHCTLENNYLRYLGQKTWYVFLWRKISKILVFHSSFFGIQMQNTSDFWNCRNYEVELLIEWYYFDMIL